MKKKGLVAEQIIENTLLRKNVKTKVRNISVSVASEVAVLLGGKRKEVGGLQVFPPD